MMPFDLDKKSKTEFEKERKKVGLIKLLYKICLCEINCGIKYASIFFADPLT